MKVERDGVSNDHQTGTTENAAPAPKPRPRPGANSNHVSRHEGTTTSSGSGNDRTESKSLAERVREEVAVRLADNPSYLDKDKELAAAQAMFADFSLVEANSLWAGDGKLTLADIRAVAADPHRPAHVREAAERLLAKPEIWASASKDGITLSNQELMTFINTKKSELETIRKDVETQVRADLGVAPPNPSPSSNTGDGATGATGKKEDPVAGEINNAGPKPTPSTMGGMEGAYENANNLLGWAEGEMDRLNALLAKTDDPKTQKQIENQMNQLTRRMQSITAMITQLATMMSTISKMYSDIAMNSVRNMK